MRPDNAIVFWEGESRTLAEGLTLVRCGGHFDGGTVLHWAGGAEGRGALLTGDIIQVVPDRKHVSFMYSYPNYIPLPAYMEAADNALELAKALAGQGGISDQDFLERMARSDELVDHDGKTCGMCHNMILGAQVAREMIEAGAYTDVVSQWATEARRRWEESKFFKLWQE